jgi:predicted Zn-dependent protease
MWVMSSSCFAQRPSTLEEQFGAAQRAMMAGDLEAAQTGFEQIARVHPELAEVHSNLGLVFFRERKFDRAVDELRRAVQLKPSLEKSQFILAISLAELGRHSEALPGLQRGFQSADREVQRSCGLELLRAYTDLNRDGDAVSTAVVLNKQFPSDPEVLYHTGRIYGNYAYVIMERLHDKAPGSIWMLQAQGEANESQKNYDSAIISFNHVLILEPSRPGIHYRIGRVYLARFSNSRMPEDRIAARKEFLAELDNDPENGNALYELAQLSAEDNTLDAAREMFEAVVKRFPDFEQAWVGLAGVYLQTNSPSEAISALEHATKLEPSDEVAWYRLARAQQSAGNREAANTALSTFRTLHSSASMSQASPTHDDITPQKLDPAPEP